MGAYEAVTRHLRAQGSFYIPSSDVRNHLEPGHIAKLLFQFEHGDEIFEERMWVQVTEVVNEDPKVIWERSITSRWIGRMSRSVTQFSSGQGTSLPSPMSR